MTILLRQDIQSPMCGRWERSMQGLIEDVSDEDNIVETILQVFTSWIDSLLSDYNAAFYYQPRDYIAECYRQKTVLDG